MLTYGEKLSAVFPIYESSAWLPLGRDLPENSWEPALRLGGKLTGVPRGALLQVNFTAGVVVLRRTYHRPEYAIHVDESRLRFGSAVQLRRHGLIEYVLADAPRTALTYQLTRRS